MAGNSAAHRAGIKTFILPKENVKDIVDLPEKVRQDLQLIAVETMDEVLNIALVPPIKLMGGEVKAP